MNAQPTGADRAGLARRLWTYQSERFPLVQHAPLIAVFTFSAASYSRVCRGAGSFIPLGIFLTGALTSLLFFLLLRVLDEFKDAADDAAFRPYRPVPRGLVTLRELGWLGGVCVAIIVIVNAIVAPVMLWAVGLGLVYMAVMAREFFVPRWLKARPLLYMASHMVIMPLIDFYTTGLDWLHAGLAPPGGLEFFLVVTFLNGVVIEVGRKIRAVEAEEHGVETYSALYGLRRATLGWLVVLCVTYISALLAASYAGFGPEGFVVLTSVFVLCSVPAWRFLRTKAQQDARLIEVAAGVWTVGMYLTLGAVPMLIEAFG